MDVYIICAYFLKCLCAWFNANCILQNLGYRSAMKINKTKSKTGKYALF